jgi:hypothetical protein
MQDCQPEVALWRAVIAQAISDATAPGRRYSKTSDERLADSERRRARRWLLGGCEDFREVCALALLEPDAVRDRARLLEQSGWPRAAVRGAAEPA